MKDDTTMFDHKLTEACPACGLWMAVKVQNPYIAGQEPIYLYTCNNAACKLYRHTITDLSPENLVRYRVKLPIFNKKGGNDALDN
jgi:hypothetical protein